MRRRIISDKLPPTTDFISTWNTSNSGVSASDAIQLPLVSAGIYNFQVYYQGVLIKTINDYTDNLVVFPDGAGEKKITIVGDISGFRFNNTGDKLKLLSVQQFGDFTLTNTGSYFYGCSNLTEVSDDLDTTGIINVGNAFRDTAISSCGIDFIDGETFTYAFRNIGILSNFSSRSFSNMTGGVGMFLDSTIPTSDWDDLLITLDNNNTNDNVTISGGNSTYSSIGETSRNNLITRGWNITDGGLEQYI